MKSDWIGPWVAESPVTDGDIQQAAEDQFDLVVKELGRIAVEAEVLSYRVFERDGKKMIRLEMRYKTETTFAEWLSAATRELLVERGPGTIPCPAKKKGDPK